jgi:uncharacterized protein YhbP (UPF0306 family)
MAADQPLEIPPHVQEFLDAQRTLTLATATPTGAPYATTFLYVRDGPSLYFWTRPGTLTARHVEQNPLVSFAIDDYGTDLGDARGAQGIGECNVVLSGEEIARVADRFGQKFPDLAPGSTMSISFFRIAPTEIQFIDNTQAGSSTASGEFGADFHKERAYSVFMDLPVEDVEHIEAELRRQTVGADEVIARQGAPADKLLIVVDGELEVVREADGRSETVATLGPGDLFGEIAVLLDRPRSATVRAMKPSTLLTIERDDFRDLIAQSLGTTRHFDQMIQARLERVGAGK